MRLWIACEARNSRLHPQQLDICSAGFAGGLVSCSFAKFDASHELDNFGKPVCHMSWLSSGKCTALQPACCIAADLKPKPPRLLPKGRLLKIFLDPPLVSCAPCSEKHRSSRSSKPAPKLRGKLRPGSLAIVARASEPGAYQRKNSLLAKNGTAGWDWDSHTWHDPILSRPRLFSDNYHIPRRVCHATCVSHCAVCGSAIARYWHVFSCKSALQRILYFVMSFL